jgi:hypothetical protein
MTIQLETIIMLNICNNHTYIDNVCALMCAKCSASIRYIRYINGPTNELGSMDVIALCSGHQHVSVTHMAIFRVVRERIQIYVTYIYLRIP